MNTLDENIFTDCICPYLTGKIIDDILLVNKKYNKVVKADMKHLYSLFWTIDEKARYSINGHLWYKKIFKDGYQEGEQLEWWGNGQLCYKHFYKEGKLEGERFDWYINGNLCSKRFYNNGKFERVMN